MLETVKALVIQKYFQNHFCELVRCLLWPCLIASLRNRKHATAANTAKPTINPAAQMIKLPN